jgi:hypothetical protein
MARTSTSYTRESDAHLPECSLPAAASSVPEHPGEFQNDHCDERDSRDDCHPGRSLVKPLGIWRRYDNERRRGGRRRDRRLGWLAHTSNDASGQQRPRPGSGPGRARNLPVRARNIPAAPPAAHHKTRSPAPTRDAGLMAVVMLDGFGSARAEPEPATVLQTPARATVPDRTTLGGIQRLDRGGAGPPRLVDSWSGDATRGDDIRDDRSGRP